MIRLAIIAERRSQAQALANLLAQDERMEILHAGDRLSGLPEGMEDITDVLIAAGIAPGQIPVRGVPVVLLSDGPARGEVFTRDLRASLPLRSSLTELSAAIAAAAAHLFVLTNEQVQQRSRTAVTEINSVEFAEALTPRELEVLRTLANGLGNKEIAEQLGVSNNTVKFHIAQIMAKLGAHSRTEAVTIGMRRGLVAV